MSRHASSDEYLVRNSLKILNLDMQEIENGIDFGNGTLDHKVKASGVTLPIRLIIRVRAPRLEKWAMAIVFKDQRIDGIDWEARVNDHRGTEFNCSGWHRHIWKPDGLDIHKECLPTFVPNPNRRAFIIDGFAVLNIQLREDDVLHAHSKLPID
jgi:hypothetical protein